MYTRITINGITKIDCFKTKAEALEGTGVKDIRDDVLSTVVQAKEDTLYIFVEGPSFVLNALVPGGKLNTTIVGDDVYPGMDIEYIPDDETEDDPLTRPRVLIEKPVETNKLRALIWADKDSEDYSHEIEF